MRKVIMNENWDLEEFDDLSNLFLLIVKQNLPSCSYIYKSDTSPESLIPDYDLLLNQYQDFNVDAPLNIYIVQVPNTKQICDNVGCCNSLEKGSTEEAIAAINNILNRADCEVLESWCKEPLTEKRQRTRKKQPFDSLTYTTGCPALNMNFFNSRFGTGELEGGSCGDPGCFNSSCTEGTLSEALLENEDEPHRQGERGRVPGKRYIKRYYIRPQNIFCSKKSDILQALVKDVGEENCSVYSLKSLADHDDVHLLQPSDIIYYYDDGILYDKNHVKVMDYDLNVKHEEERKKFANINSVSDSAFDAEYDDRLTEDLEHICCICGEEFEGYGNNPAPVSETGRCCDACNLKFVIPARLEQLDKE